MQDVGNDFNTGDFHIKIEGGPRLAFMRLDRDTAGMKPEELSALSRRLASTRKALLAAGYRVRYVDPPRGTQRATRKRAG